MGNSFKDASAKFKVPYSTVRKMASRKGWTKKAVEESQRTIIERVSQIAAETWAEKAEAHRRKMYALASDALAQAKLPPPKNWRDVETADKIARRAAGLEDGEQGRQLVQIALLGRGPEPAEIDPV
jgi:hypothetical protein